MPLSREKNGWTVAFRGFTPTVFRQMGAGLGMFVFPGWIERKFKAYAPTPYKDTPSKGAYAFASGVATAVLTQYPDTVRVVMQSDANTGLKDACQLAVKRMKRRESVISCGFRVPVLGIATAVMSWGRENYPKYFTNENRS